MKASKLALAAATTVAISLGVGACGTAEKADVISPGAPTQQAAPPETIAPSTDPKSRPYTDVHNFLNDSTVRTLTDLFAARYQVQPADVQLLVVPASALGAFADVTQLPDESVLVAYTVGDLTDLGAHPPAGSKLPTGKLGYVIVLRGGDAIGGGLLVDDLSPELLKAAGTTATSLEGL